MQHRALYPLIRMEGIQHKMVNMLYHTWAIHCSVALTNHLLDNGEKCCYFCNYETTNY